MFPMLLALVVGAAQPLVLFIIVAVIIAVALFYLPRMLPMDAQVWMAIRAVVIVALLLWALRLFGVI